MSSSIRQKLHDCIPERVRTYVRSLFTPKSIEELRQDSSDTALKKKLNFFDLTCLGIGCIIGSGIFVLTGQAAGNNAGPAVVISFLIGGFCAGLAALCYAEMASMLPVSGSAYTYTYAALGEFLAWLVGWNLILEYVVGAATVSVGWSSYVVAFLEAIGGHRNLSDPHWTSAPFGWNETHSYFYMSGNYLNVPAVVIILALTVLLVIGTRESSVFNVVIVIVKVVVILIFIGASIKWIDPGNWQPFIPKEQGFGHYGWSGILQATTMVFFSYIGFDAVSTTAQECARPQRDLPIGIISSLIICTVLYVAVCLCLTGLVPYRALIGQANPISFASAYIGLDWLEIVTEIGAIAGTTSVMLVNLMSQPRVFFSMARDGLFPRWIARAHPRFGTPYIPTMITGVVTATLGGLLPITILGELTSVGTLSAFVLVSLSVCVMRFTHKELPRKFVVPFGSFLIPILSAVCSAALIGWSTNATKIRFVIWIAIGIVFYIAYGKRNSLWQKKLELLRSGQQGGDIMNADDQHEAVGLVFCKKF